MAISIDWGTQIIDVPKSATTLVQASPVEIRELNINDFRLTLKDLEDNVDGIPHLRTHNHNTEVLLGGIVYARVVEIINGYTITFEDGNYAVNLVGANSNIGDVVNLNSVSIRSSNSAGLISNQAIEYASFNGGVTVDAINGTTGTVFPRGTPQLPVNNIPDAILISEVRGFRNIYIIGDFTFVSGYTLNDYRIYGESPFESKLSFSASSIVNEIKVFDATVQGFFDGITNFNKCIILNINNVTGRFEECELSGDILLGAGSGQTSFIHCEDGLSSDTGLPVIDFNGSNNSVIIREYHGDIALHNKSTPESVEINMSTGGHVLLENTITNGNIRVTGIAEVTDNTTGSTIVDTSQVIYPDHVQLAAFNEYVYLSPLEGSAGVKFPLGTLQNPVNNIADALIISSNRGLAKIVLDGTLYLTDTDLSGKVIIGENNLDSVIISVSGNTMTRTTFNNMILSGEINGYIFGQDIILENITNVGSTVFPTIFRNCIVREDSGSPAITFNSGATKNIHFIDCASGVPGQGTATLDFNNSLAPVAFRRYGGGISVDNITGNQDCTFEFNQGQIKFLSGCTSGTVRLGGIYKLTDNSNTLTIEERNQSITDNITVTGVTASADTTAIAAAVWDKLTTDHQDAGSFGLLLYDLLVASGTIQHGVNLNTELLINKPNNP